MLDEFYAVTMTSVYHAQLGNGVRQPTLTKIAARARSRVAIGNEIKGPMLSVGKQLIMFIPESGAVRQIGLVNSRNWLGGTSNVVALFFTREGSLVCDNAQDHKSCDPRWREETIRVLQAIGEEHPRCSISTSDGLRLLHPKEWRQ